MSVRRVTKFPERILKNKTSYITKIDDELKALVKDMFDTMYLEGGVGLSANQIGVNKKVAVINPTGEKKDELVLINPEIMSKKGSAKMEEGCLSIPGASAEVKRAREVEIKFMDLDGNYRQLKLKGLLARIAQHELDHLNGSLFIDRISFLKRRNILKNFRRMEKT